MAPASVEPSVSPEPSPSSTAPADGLTSYERQHLDLLGDLRSEVVLGLGLAVFLLTALLILSLRGA